MEKHVIEIKFDSTDEISSMEIELLQKALFSCRKR